MTFTIPVYAAVKYKDVPETYWAFNEINDVSDRGLLVGDASGDFHPDDPIDKFETARVLAKAAGYKYTNVSEAESTYYKQAYEKNKSVIDQYSKPYSKWKGTYDYEIAYLLEKEVFTVEDLSQFITKDANGVQQYRALSRQEAAVYIVKLMGMKSEALTGEYDMSLSDDADLKKADKPYVYYLLEVGILDSGENGKFRPNDWVTRASLAVMLSDSLTYTENHGGDISQQTGAIRLNEGNPTQITSLTGNITNYLPESDSIQIVSGLGSNTYKLAPGVNIYIDSFLKTRADLKEGMAVKAVLSNNLVTEIQATGLSLTSSVLPVSNLQVSTVEGLVNDIRNNAAGTAIDLTFINQDGKPDANKTFVLDKNCKITRDGADITTDSLNEGDMVMADISGGICLDLTLEDPVSELTGTLQEIHITADDESVVLKTDDGDMKTLYINPGKVDVYTLRVGMKIHFNLDNRSIIAAEILSS